MTVWVVVYAPQLVVTVAVNWALPPGGSSISCGLTSTLTISSVTFMVAMALEAGTGRLVATTWYVPALDGAV